MGVLIFNLTLSDFSSELQLGAHVSRWGRKQVARSSANERRFSEALISLLCAVGFKNICNYRFTWGLWPNLHERL